MHKLTNFENGRQVDYLFNVTQTETEATVRVVSTEGSTASFTFNDDVKHRITPIVIAGVTVGNLCYVPTATADQILSLNATFTLFIAADGAIVPSNSVFREVYGEEGRIYVINPHDTIYSVVLSDWIDMKGNIMRYDVQAARLISNTHVPIKALTIYTPTKGANGMYTHKSDGIDSLAHTDLVRHDVLEVTFMFDSKLRTEYVSIGGILPENEVLKTAKSAI